MNSETTRKRVEHLQSKGQWGARDFDKVLFTLPIPRFSAKEKLHLDLSAAGLEAEKAAAKVDIPPEMYFLTARNRVREALNESGISEKIDELVEKLLGD